MCCRSEHKIFRYKINNKNQFHRSPAQAGCMRQVLRAGALGRPRGIGWRGVGRGDWDGEYMYIHGWFMSMYGKNHYNKKKKISFNTKHQQQSLKTSATKFEDIISTPFIISTKRRSRIKIIIWGIFRRKL